MNKRTYLEHTAVLVPDLDWHLDLFTTVFGMEVREETPNGAHPRQAWLYGGIQLIEADDGQVLPDNLSHLGLMTEDMEAVIEGCRRWGAVELSNGRNWLRLSSGLCLEVLQAKGEAVAEYWRIEPR